MTKANNTNISKVSTTKKFIYLFLSFTIYKIANMNAEMTNCDRAYSIYTFCNFYQKHLPNVFGPNKHHSHTVILKSAKYIYVCNHYSWIVVFGLLSSSSLRVCVTSYHSLSAKQNFSRKYQHCHKNHSTVNAESEDKHIIR